MLSRCKKGSFGRKKEKFKIIEFHKKIRDSRNTYLHQVSRGLVDKYDQLFFEDIKIENLVKNGNLSKSIYDQGWSKLVGFVEYKSRCDGKTFLKVNPAYTSQTCSSCGKRKKLSLKERTYECVSCGLNMDRDHNAAINILNKGLNQTGV